MKVTMNRQVKHDGKIYLPEKTYGSPKTSDEVCTHFLGKGFAKPAAPATKVSIPLKEGLSEMANNLDTKENTTVGEDITKAEAQAEKEKADVEAPAEKKDKK